MTNHNGSFESIARVLADRAAEHGERTLYTTLVDGERESGSSTYQKLHARAGGVARELRARGLQGERVLVLCDSPLEFAAAFFGCLHAGAIAVPCPPPMRANQVARLRGVWDDATPRAILTVSSAWPAIERVASDAGVSLAEGAAVLFADAIGDDPSCAPSARADDIAFLQYTSGSTSTPKGVAVSHANLVENSRAIAEVLGHDERTVMVSWLPLFHDMGLIGTVVQSLFVGGRCVLMPPLAFLKRPGRWLRAIDRYRGTTSGAPNFAYELCLRRIAAEERAGIDLSSWKVAFNGAEPVRADTMERFARTFAPNGFSAASFFPCYGLAEATLMVSAHPARRNADGRPLGVTVDRGALAEARVVAAGDSGAIALVACGPTVAGQELAIVDPATLVRRPADGVGEIWVSGPSVAQGYWNRPAESASTFGATLADSDRRWLRTGDLGFVSGGELYVTGRLKDLVVVHGRNLYPQDLELTAERAHPAVEAGAVAAFSITADGCEDEQIVLVVEQRQQASDADRRQLVDAIRAAVTAEQEVAIYDFVFIGAGKLPRTTSGKVRRSECRARYLGGAFGDTGRFRLDGDAATPLAAERGAADAVWTSAPAERLPLVAKVLTTIASRALERAFADVSPFVPLPAQGLDSVRAVQMAHDIELELGCVVDAAQLLDGKTLLDWATRIAMGAAPRAVEAPPAPVPPVMTTAQRSLAAVERLAAPATPSNLFFAAWVDGALDARALETAIARVTERHEALRTTFADDGTVVVHATARVDLEELHATADDVGALVQAQAEAPFDLATGPLLRCRIVHAGDGRAALLLVAHHLVSDLWSLEIVLDELGACYGEAAGGGPAQLSIAPPFSAWARQQAEWDRSDEARRAAEHWREALRELPALNVPTDRPRGTRPTYRGALVRQTVDEATLAGLRRLARESDATLFAVLMTAFQATLARYSGQRDLVVGYTAQTRGGATHAGTVGMLINLLPCRATLPDGASFRACVARTAATLRTQAEHARLATASIFEQVDPAQRSERGLFQAFLAFEQAHLPRLRDFPLLALGRDGVEVPFGPLTLRGLPVARSASQFELMLYAGVGERELQLVLEYNADLFEPPTVERLMRHFGALLRAAIATPDRELPLLPMLDDEDVRVQLEELNPTWQGAPATRCLHEIFAETAARVPDRVAVVDGTTELSYRRLDERADALARRLMARGAGPGVPVALHMKPSADMVVAIVGVLKAGAAYVPLDSNQPLERLRFALADCARAGARLLIADAPTWPAAERLAADAGYELLAVDGAGETAELPPVAPSDARDVAYVIYTSGSTGTPKGVMNTHRNVVRLLEHCEPVFAFTEDDVWSQFHSYSFDVSVWEIWGALLYGGRLVIVPESTRRAPRKLYELLHEHGVTILSQTPAAFQQLMSVDEPWGTAHKSRLRAIAFAGEALDIPSLRPWMERYDGAVPAMINMYGITETCVHVTHRVLDLPTVRRTTKSVIGGPIRDLRLYLLDEHRQLVPQGAPGEIHVVGPGLADGYLGRPGLTAERFIASPFGAPGERMYASGDLARYTADGDLEYLGRRDHQVKIRGHRIELGEVQHALSLHPSVNECLVVTRKDRFGALELVAHVACAQPSRELEQQLRRFAGERLPAYAVPGRIHSRREFPLTVNGKVDRRALEAESAASPGEALHAPERTPCEAALSVLWCEVLGVESAAPSDNFFERGGHSLLATRLTNRVQGTMGIKLSLATLYEHPTLGGLAAAIDRQRHQGGAADREIVRAPEEGGGAPLSFAQERIWIAEQLQPGTALFNVPIALELEGNVEPDRLAAALQAVTQRHDVLRSYVVAHKSAPVQVAAPELAVELPLVDLADAGAQKPERLAEALRMLARTPIPLTTPPLFRVLLVRLAADRHVLAFTVHHLIADLLSAVLLIGEVARQYAATLQPDAAAPPPSPELRYADFARWERQRAEAGGLDAGLQYWRDKLAAADTSVSLAPDLAAGAGERRGALVRKRLPPGLLARIAPVRQRFGCTTYAFLLTAFKVLVARYTGRRDVAIGTDVAVREREELRDVVGLFVNQVVLRTALDGDPTFEEALARVSATLVGALTNAHVPIQLVLDETGLARVGEQPFRILFDFQSYELPQVDGLPFTMRRLASDWETAKYDLSIFIEQERGHMAATLEYDADRFHESTAMRLLAHFVRIVEQAIEHPTRRLSELRLVEADTLQKAASVFNEQL